MRNNDSVHNKSGGNDPSRGGGGSKGGNSNSGSTGNPSRGSLGGTCSRGGGDSNSGWGLSWGGKSPSSNAGRGGSNSGSGSSSGGGGNFGNGPKVDAGRAWTPSLDKKQTEDKKQTDSTPSIEQKKECQTVDTCRKEIEELKAVLNEHERESRREGIRDWIDGDHSERVAKAFRGCLTGMTIPGNRNIKVVGCVAGGMLGWKMKEWEQDVKNAAIEGGVDMIEKIAPKPAQ